MRLRLKMMFASYSAFSCAWAACDTTAWAQTALPQVDVTVASPIVRRAPARPSPQTAPAQPAPNQPAAPSMETLVGTVPIVTDQFATITVVPNDELRRNGASTLGDLLFEVLIGFLQCLSHLIDRARECSQLVGTPHIESGIQLSFADGLGRAHDRQLSDCNPAGGRNLSASAPGH